MKPCPLCGRMKHNQYTSCAGMPSEPARFSHSDDRLSVDEIQRVSALADAACPRFILILHPNFSLDGVLGALKLGPMVRSAGVGR